MFDIKNILFPIDLDSEDISPVVKALEIAETFQSPIHIFYVNDSQAGYRHPTDREDAVALRIREVVPAAQNNICHIQRLSGGRDC
jgi:hypothetical protein